MSKLTKLVASLVVIAILLLIAMCYHPLIKENERMRRDIYLKDQQIAAQEKLAKDLQNQIDALTNDPKTVERLTREKLGYAKPEETVIHFEPPGTNFSYGH